MRSGTFPALAVGIVVLAALIVFFPTLFFGRVISPLDTIANSPPWSGIRPPVQVSNPDLEAPATVALPAVAAMDRDGTSTAVWDPYTAGGRPGWLTWGSEGLSPFVTPLLPFVGQARILNVATLAKLLVAYLFTWLLLRRHGRSESASALGALAFALSAPLIVGWLRPGGGGAALLPMLLWTIDRTNEHRWQSRASAVGLAWLAFAVAGPPTVVVLGGYLALVWLWAGSGPTSARITSALGGAAAATLVMAPSILLWWQAQGGPGSAHDPSAFRGWGPTALRLLVDPFTFGDPRRETFAPPPTLSGLAFHEVCITLGWLTVVLAVIGILVRSRHRWFWIGTGCTALAAMALTPVGRMISRLPGLSQLEPPDLAPLVALAAAAVAAAGWDGIVRTLDARHVAVGAVLFGTALGLQQGLLAGHLLTYLPPEDATFRSTPGLRWLVEHSAPGQRVAPLFRTLPPNTASTYGLEDVRTYSGAIPRYRDFLARIDPQVTGRQKPVLLNGATIDLRHPYLAAMGARWVLEPPDLNLVQFGLLEDVLETGPRMGALGPFSPRSHVVQKLRLPTDCSRIGVPVRAVEDGDVRLRIDLVENAGGRTLTERTGLLEVGTAPTDLWLELPAGVRARSVDLHVRCVGGKGRLTLRRTEPTAPGIGELLVDGKPRRGALLLLLDTSGYVLAYDGPDMRIWESRTALSRAWLVERTTPGDLSTLLDAAPPLDLKSTAVVVEADHQPTSLEPATGTVEIRSIGPNRLELHTVTARPALLVTSTTAYPALWEARVDDAPVRLTRVNGLFLGLPLERGRHDVVLTARLPSRWLAATALGTVILLGMMASTIGTRRHGEAT